jgi:hypothetical protein
MCADGCPPPSKNPKIFEEETLGLDLGAQATLSARDVFWRHFLAASDTRRHNGLRECFRHQATPIFVNHAVYAPPATFARRPRDLCEDVDLHSSCEN